MSIQEIAKGLISHYGGASEAASAIDIGADVLVRAADGTLSSPRARHQIKQKGQIYLALLSAPSVPARETDGRQVERVLAHHPANSGMLLDNEKLCKTCRLPKDRKLFRYDSHTVDKLSPECDDCRAPAKATVGQVQQRWCPACRASHPENAFRIIAMQDGECIYSKICLVAENKLTKRCAQCNKSLPIESFGVNKKAADGRDNLCWSCAHPPVKSPKPPTVLAVKPLKSDGAAEQIFAALAPTDLPRDPKLYAQLAEKFFALAVQFDEIARTMQTVRA